MGKTPRWELLEIKEGAGDYRPRSVHTYRSPTGVTAKFDMVGGGDGASVFALTPTNEVIYVTQFRPGPPGLTLELPGGGVNQGELPANAAIRELLEETGHAGDEPVLLGTIQHPYSLFKNHSYLILNCEKVAEPDLDETEDAVWSSMPIETFVEYILPGYSSPDLVTIYRALHKIGWYD